MSGEQPTMADVLAGHQRKTGLRDMRRHCYCGWSGEVTDSFITHQAAALSAAGFGPVREARAEVWDECARDAYEKTGEEGLMDALRNTNPYRKDAQ